jgi:YVTN family beta-propeller protein
MSAVIRRWLIVAASLALVAAVAFAGTMLWPSDDDAHVSVGARGSDAAAADSATTTTPPSTTTIPPTTTTTTPPVPAIDRPLILRRTITGDISPKSVVATENGLVVANNMMYRHTMTLYDGEGSLVATIPDSVDLAAFGYPEHPGISRGAPVEGAVSHDRKHYYATNYSMYGANFGPEGSDECRGPEGLSPSFTYRVSMETLQVDAVAQVGMVPKYVAVTPDGRYVLVTNWCSYDLSVIDAKTMKEVKRVPIGAYPRGIAVDPKSTVAYVAMMGGTQIAKVDLATFGVSWIASGGTSPRHLVLDPTGALLFVTLNGSNRIAKIDTATGTVVATAETGSHPRSMTISPDGTALYVVNYESNTVSKVRAADLAVGESVPTPSHPIGIAYEPKTNRLFVACYSGAILVFDA